MAKVKFWGTRGSIPSPGNSTIKYGGNTACIEIISDKGHSIILDSGTGIRDLGIEISKKPQNVNINILLSHTHADHINGFPFFEPAFKKGNIINIYGPVYYEKKLSDIISMQMEYYYFPVRTAELNATLNYIELKEQEFDIGDFHIKTRYMNHPVLTLGYKITIDNKTIMYTGDTEPYYNFLGKTAEDDCDPDTIILEENNRMIEFIKGVDLLIADSQYTKEEYETKKRGWGHSYVESVVQLAVDCGIKKLALFHHDPQHTDRDIDEMEKNAKDIITSSSTKDMQVFAAREGEEVII